MADLGRQLEAELEGLQAQGLMGIQGLGVRVGLVRVL